MSMSVGVLDHYNVSTATCAIYRPLLRGVLGLVNGPRPAIRLSRRLALQRSHRCCISTTFRLPTSRSGRIRASSTTSPLAARLRRHQAAPHAKGVPFRVNEVAEQLAPTDFRYRS